MSGSSTGAPSIRDVAHAAGVSVATVSRVMAKTDYPVASATRARVIEAARNLGFVPNALARGLSLSRTDSIGVVAPILSNPYYAAMVEGIDEVAHDFGLTMLLGLTGGDESRREIIIDEFLSRRVDGLLICAGASDQTLGRKAEVMGIPTVLIGQQPNAGFPIITTDNRRAGFDATDYLWGLGHRKFAFLTSRDSWHDFHERGQGMFDCLHDKDERFEAQVFEGLYNEADAYCCVRDIYSNGSAVTALLASTDRHAMGALAALSDETRKVPDNVSVMGFDDYVTSNFIRPSLTTMHIPSAEMGRISVSKLTNMLKKKDVRHETVLTASLIKRHSTGRVANE